MGTLNVRNRAQQILFEEELKGQISDGRWENSSPQDHWIPWCNAKVVVNAENVGRNFYARRDGYCFTEKDLLSIIGDRMLEMVQKEQPEYTEKDMIADLRDLRKIIKITRTETPAERDEAELERLEKKKRAEALARYKERLADRVDSLLGGYTSRYGTTVSLSWSKLEALLDLAEKGAQA